MTCNMLLANEIFLQHRLGSFLSETNWKNVLHIKINIFANLPTRTRALKVNIDLKWKDSVVFHALLPPDTFESKFPISQ